MPLPEEPETFLFGLVIYIEKEFVVIAVVEIIVVVVAIVVLVATRTKVGWLRCCVMFLEHGICFAELLELCGRLGVPWVLVWVRMEGQLCFFR